MDELNRHESEESFFDDENSDIGVWPGIILVLALLGSIFAIPLLRSWAY